MENPFRRFSVEKIVQKHPVFRMMAYQAKQAPEKNDLRPFFPTNAITEIRKPQFLPSSIQTRILH